jgi:hypothetical protein
MIGHDHWCFFRENTIDGSARLELQPIAFTPHPNQTQSWPSDTHETRQLAEPTTSSDASQSWPPVLLHGPPVAVRSWPPRGELPAGRTASPKRWQWQTGTCTAPGQFRTPEKPRPRQPRRRRARVRVQSSRNHSRLPRLVARTRAYLRGQSSVRMRGYLIPGQGRRGMGEELRRPSLRWTGCLIRWRVRAW